LPKTDEEKAKAERLKAKVFNFGILAAPKVFSSIILETNPPA
jgi:hypothetical protein